MKKAWAVLWLIAAAASAQTAARPGSGVTATLEKLSKEGAAAREQNRVDDAIAAYKKGVALKASWDEGWWNLGTLYYALDDYVHASEAFRRLTLLKPEAAVGWGMLGLCQFETKQYDDSLAHLRRGIELGVSEDQQISDVIHYHYALLLTRYEHYEEALKILALFAQRELNHPNYVEAEGLAALRKPLLPSELPPADRELVMDAGRAMYDASALKTAAAAAEFKTLVEKYPRRPNIHYIYGSFLLFSDVNEALAEFKKELEIFPGNVPALVVLASEYLKSKDYKAALPYAEQAVTLGPRSFPAHTILGRILSEGDGDAERGVKELELARQLEPGSPQVRVALAAAYIKTGRKEEASKERQEFLKLNKLAEAAKGSAP